MRLLLLGTLALVGTAVAASPVAACPRGAVCVGVAQGFAQGLNQRDEIAAAPIDPATLPSMRIALSAYTEHTAAAEDGTLTSGASPATYTLTMNAVWGAFAAGVDERLPKIHAGTLELTLAPVIVQTAFVKIPGLGFSAHY